MSELGSCHMCDRPANSMYTGSSRWSKGKEFCSSNCQDAHFGKFAVYVGGSLLIISFIFLIVNSPSSSLVLFIIGLGVSLFGLYYMSLATPTKRGITREKVSLSGHSFGSANEPQDQMIYSNILFAMVHPCCHQSARLNDQYCACGRAIEYPS